MQILSKGERDTTSPYTPPRSVAHYISSIFYCGASGNLIEEACNKEWTTFYCSLMDSLRIHAV